MNHLKTFESYNPIIFNEIKNFVEKQMKIDKAEYKGHVKTKYNPGSPWSDNSWLVTEIMQYLLNEYSISHILQELGGKYTNMQIEEAIKFLYPKEYKQAQELIEYSKNI